MCERKKIGDERIDYQKLFKQITNEYSAKILNWLVDREFLSLNGNKYSTTFPIIGKKHRQDIGDLYSKTRTDYIDKIINYLYNHESDIKKIGFYGSDFEIEKLMWSIIMLFLNYFSRNSEIAVKLKEKNDRPIREDGGQYYIIGNDLSDNQKLVISTDQTSLLCQKTNLNNFNKIFLFRY